MKLREFLLWFIFFGICMTAGFLHGILPQGLPRSYVSKPQQVRILLTDEILFPESLQKEIEEELNVKFIVTVTRNWETVLVKTVATPSEDLILLPSFWAETLIHQKLVTPLDSARTYFYNRAASDFISASSAQTPHFMPLYWIKTSLQTADFQKFLSTKDQNPLYLIADEDLLLKHFTFWKEKNLLSQIQGKKIIPMPLDQIGQTKNSDAVFETSLKDEIDGQSVFYQSALLIWGAIIPDKSSQKVLAASVLRELTETKYQERLLLETPFNSALSTVQGDRIPLHRRASHIRELKLKETLLLDKKNPEASSILRNEFGITL